MGTKRLSRSVLEGGHAPLYRDQRVILNKRLRRRERHVCHMARDVYNAGDDVCDVDVRPVLPARMRYSEKFTDKLNPAWRYLCSQHGRKWDDVRSDLCWSFDVRGLAGYHVLIQHMLAEVEPKWPRLYFGERFGRFYVDDDGFLHSSDKESSARARSHHDDEGSAYAEFSSIASYDHVDVDDDDRAYWVKHIDPWFDECNDSACDSSHAHRKSHRTGEMVRVHREPRVIWSRVRELNDHEYTLWHRLSQWYKRYFDVIVLHKHDELYRREQQRRIGRVLQWRVARMDGNPLAPKWYYGTHALPELGIY